MRITPLLLAKRNIIETYHDLTIFYSLFPAAFLLLTQKYCGNIHNDYLHLITGLALVFGSMDCATFSISKEKERENITKLFLSAVSRWSITGGKLLSALLLGLLKTTLVVVVLIQTFEMLFDVYQIAWFYIISSIITLLSVSIGLLCFSICKSLKSTALLSLSLLSFFAISPAFFLLSNSREIMNQYNPFEIEYNFLGKLLKNPQSIEMSFVSDLAYVLIWIILLYISASIMLKKKIS